MKNNDFIIFGLTNATKIAQDVANKLKVKLGRCTTTKFADGEILVKFNETVRGKDVYIFQSTSKPVNDSLMELLIAIDALKRASAKTINVIIPYYGYARQDRKSQGREPITAKLVANFIKDAGATKVVLMDIHADQIQGFFDIPVDTLKGTWIMIDEFLKTHKFKDLCIVSPDYGGVKRARNIANSLNAPLAIVDKRRPAPNQVEVSNILGDVKGKDCLLVDDMIDTGGTMMAASRLLKERGAKSINIMCTHALFSNNAIEKFNKCIQDGDISNIYISDSIQASYEYMSKNIHVCSLASFYAEFIKIQSENKSISQNLYGKQIERLNAKK